MGASICDGISARRVGDGNGHSKVGVVVDGRRHDGDMPRPGTAYGTGNDPKSGSPDCGHTYRNSSARQAGQAFAVSATVHWTVSWSGAGQSGTFPGMTTTSNAAFRVAEAQALNNGG
ncbi:hypothetical protein SAMN05661093_11211 [Kibdelosporangium aridum]|uniref:ATP/GTP-binding protein n=2 Tax=Kibdelosporangium aridum TaxID=2030 RepID=A0A1W2G0E5_KIBAR|nr:hypothetical protein SAMN05661093_11211 [Kibdelosporangium aridum]